MVPSIPSISNIILDTMNETVLNEEENLIACTHKDDDIACSNDDLDLHVGGVSYFMVISEKYDVVNYVSAALYYFKKNANF